MATNKIVLNGKTLIDLTEDTVSEETVLKGYKFHKPNGVQGIGSYEEKSKINGLIEKYKVNEGKTVAAGDFVELIPKSGSKTLFLGEPNSNYVTVIRINEKKAIWFQLEGTSVVAKEFVLNDKGWEKTIESKIFSTIRDVIHSFAIAENLFIFRLGGDPIELLAVKRTSNGFIVGELYNSEGDFVHSYMFNLMAVNGFKISDNKICLFEGFSKYNSTKYEYTYYFQMSVLSISEDLKLSFIKSKAEYLGKYSGGFQFIKLGNTDKFIVSFSKNLYICATDGEEISITKGYELSSSTLSASSAKLYDINENNFIWVLPKSDKSGFEIKYFSITEAVVTEVYTKSYNFAFSSFDYHFIMLNDNYFAIFIYNDTSSTLVALGALDDTITEIEPKTISLNSTTIYYIEHIGNGIVDIIYGSGDVYTTSYQINTVDNTITKIEPLTNGIFAQPATISNRIQGLAKTSGTSGEEIEVYVPNL